MKYKGKIGEGMLLFAVLLAVLAACLCAALIRRPASAVVTPVHEVSVELPKLNVNAATTEDLCRLPGIGETLAERIGEYRRENGGFSSIDELEQVEGIGAQKLDAIRDLICVE